MPQPRDDVILNIAGQSCGFGLSAWAKNGCYRIQGWRKPRFRVLKVLVYKGGDWTQNYDPERTFYTQ